MKIFDIFTSEQEKKYRRYELHRKFCDTAYYYLEDEKSFQDFINGKACFIFHSNSPKSYGFGGKITLSRKDKVIDLSQLPGFIKVMNQYRELKNKKISWQETFDGLNDAIFDLLVEAVFEFEKKYSLPKRW